MFSAYCLMYPTGQRAQKLYLLCGVYFIFQNGDSAHVLRIFDEEAQAMQSVHNSKRMLADSISTGAAILSKYSEQRERLKVFLIV